MPLCHGLPPASSGAYLRVRKAHHSSALSLQVQNEMLALVHLFMSGPIYKSTMHAMQPWVERRLAAAQACAPRKSSYMCCLKLSPAHRLTWNLMGMMNNPHYRVRVHVDTNATGHMAMVFEHPTKSGSEAGG